MLKSAREKQHISFKGAIKPIHDFLIGGKEKKGRKKIQCVVEKTADNLEFHTQ